ncbi:sensor histidine kinase, partial [Spirosoma jeollabukense]
NGFGLGNYSYKRILIVVPPRWYETWWMRLIMILLALTVIWGVIRLRFRYIIRENQKLEQVIASRTNQLKESEQALSRQLHLQSRLMASITHDIQSPLQFLAYTSRRAHGLLANMNNSALSRIMEMIASTSETTHDLLKELLTYTKTKVYEDRKELGPIDLYDLVKNRAEVFRSMFVANHNTFVNDVPEDFLISSDHHLLGIIIHNLIDNAAKYTQQGQIRVFVGYVNHQPQLIIANPGRAMAPQTIAWFNRGYDEQESVTKLLATNKNGAGLLIVKEMAAMINVRLYVEQTDITAFHLVFSGEH